METKTKTATNKKAKTTKTKKVEKAEVKKPLTAKEPDPTNVVNKRARPLTKHEQKLSDMSMIDKKCSRQLMIRMSKDFKMKLLTGDKHLDEASAKWSE